VSRKLSCPLVRALGEEYAALVYVNFLQSILLQMRTLVVCAAGMYVLIVCSISIYPFEPHPALQVLAVPCWCYGNHRRFRLCRNASRRNSQPFDLHHRRRIGLGFLAEACLCGAIPVFSLLAVQFPEIGRFLFSWLEPLLQSAK